MGVDSVGLPTVCDELKWGGLPAPHSKQLQDVAGEILIFDDLA